MSRRTTIAGSLIILAILVLAIAIGVSRFIERGPSVISRPWVNTPYRDLPDSTLQAKADLHDTLAAMVLGSHFMDHGDTLKAVNLLLKFNPNPQTASADLNYLSAKALLLAERDTAAIAYLLPISKSKAYPNAGIDLANIYNKLKNYEQALAVFKGIDSKLLLGRDDSILVCRGNLGDTASAMKFAKKMMDEGQPLKAVPFLSKYVSLSRGISPAAWSYMAGTAFLQGNNPTRATVYLENADADTSFAQLSYNLGHAYYRIQAFDSSASKFTQALQLGDSSAAVLRELLGSYRLNNHPDKAFETSMLAIRLHPEVEEFYIIPAKLYYEEGQYEKLLALTSEAHKNVKNSYKIDSYYATASYLTNNKEKAMSLIDSLMVKYRFQAGALSGASKLFANTLGLTDVADRMKQLDPAVKFPETTYFLKWYDQAISSGDTDTCRTSLQTWIQNDTIKARRQIMIDLYNRDFPDSTQ